ncbi:MAG: ribosome biogenesis GTPase YlqF [Limnochordales bacterium]
MTEARPGNGGREAGTVELQWFPGHMAKARRELAQRLKLVHVVLEIIDARIPETSRHPRLLAAERPLPRVLLLSKADLADEAMTKAWLEYFRSLGQSAAAADLRGGAWVRRARALLRAAARDAGRRRGATRVLVAGLPNVGKSTAINSLAGRAKAATGATAGVTRGLQWLSGGPGLELLDSPGVLWPERTTGAAAVLLAATGAVPETAYDPVEAADAFLRLLLQRFPGAVAARYGPEAAADPESPLRAVARRRGALLPGGEPDLERAAALVLADFRSGRLGRLTLESPPPRGPEKGRPAGGQEADGAR